MGFFMDLYVFRQNSAVMERYHKLNFLDLLHGHSPRAVRNKFFPCRTVTISRSWLKGTSVEGCILLGIENKRPSDARLARPRRPVSVEAVVGQTSQWVSICTVTLHCIVIDLVNTAGLDLGYVLSGLHPCLSGRALYITCSYWSIFTKLFVRLSRVELWMIPVWCLQIYFLLIFCGWHCKRLTIDIRPWRSRPWTKVPAVGLVSQLQTELLVVSC